MVAACFNIELGCVEISVDDVLTNQSSYDCIQRWCSQINTLVHKTLSHISLFAYYIVKQWYRGLIEPILVWNSWHYHFCTWLKTNLSFESDIGAPAQWQFYFGPLHGFSGHHTAL